MRNADGAKEPQLENGEEATSIRWLLWFFVTSLPVMALRAAMHNRRDFYGLLFLTLWIALEVGWPFIYWHGWPTLRRHFGWRRQVLLLLIATVWTLALALVGYGPP